MTNIVFPQLFWLPQSNLLYEVYADCWERKFICSQLIFVTILQLSIWLLWSFALEML